MANSTSWRRFRHGAGRKLDPRASPNPWSGMSISPINGISMPGMRNDAQFGRDLERKPFALRALSPFGAPPFFHLRGWRLHAVFSTINEVDALETFESNYSPHALVCDFCCVGVEDSDDDEQIDFFPLVISSFDTYS